MLAIVPISFFLIVFFVAARDSDCWRRSFLLAASVWAITLTAITECLSSFDLIGSTTILGSWLVCDAVAAIAAVRKLRLPGRKWWRDWRMGLHRTERWLLGGVVLIVSSVGVVGLISPPNNWDSLSYHMSRVMHWIQNGTVAHYPTNILRQLHQNPWAEYAIMHLQVLCDGDRLANSVQWFSMGGALVAISLVAGQLGITRMGQTYSVVSCATIPMGILQGSSTYNDYVVSFWLATFVYFALATKERPNAPNAFLTGTALGLAILTKATAYLFAAPFLLWLAYSLIRSRRTQGVRAILLILLVTMAMNLAHLHRNWGLYGNPLGPGQESSTGAHRYSNDGLTVRYAVSNIVRNVALHVGTFGRLNAVLEELIRGLHGLLGLDVNDRHTTWGGTEFHVPSLSFKEDSGGNPIHFFLVVASTLIILLVRPFRERRLIPYVACVAIGFVLFCSYLKWQPWHSRLHLPLFVLWSPVVGFFLTVVRPRWITYLIFIAIVAGAALSLLHNSSRRLLGPASIWRASRTEQYFTNHPTFLLPYTGAVDFVVRSGCTDVGLALGGNGCEYPLWVLFGARTEQAVRIEHVPVGNLSRVAGAADRFKGFVPCAIIMVSPSHPRVFTVRGVTYALGWFSDPVSVFLVKQPQRGGASDQ